MTHKSNGLLLGVSAVAIWGGGIGLAQAQTSLSIDFETKSFQNRILRSGDLEVKVSYTADPGNYETPNLRYELRYRKQTAKFAEFMANFGSVRLEDLNGDRRPEVVVETFSGGAHCCTNTIVHSWQLFRFVRAETGPLDGGGGTFLDLDKDGKQEFVSADNRFLYRFSSYAGSVPPTVILRLQGNEFKDITRNYPNYLRQQAIAMKKDFLEAKAKGELYEVNGFLAGYVAQKALIGEFDDAWSFMRQNYDRQEEWGLEIYKGDQQVGRYANYPEALKAFLRESGYL